ncbi:hypothetical protein QQP08_006125 [Theobroma cacao]|nr:hypothetical protein QQP08_006125 [Theobroma cacao]
MEKAITFRMHGIDDVLIGGYLKLEVSVKLLNLLLWIYSKKLMVEQCLWLFYKMVRNWMLPDVKNSNRILKILGDKSLVAKAREVYSMMGQFRFNQLFLPIIPYWIPFVRKGKCNKRFSYYQKCKGEIADQGFRPWARDGK